MITLYVIKSEKSYAIIRRNSDGELPVSPLPSGKVYEVIATAQAATVEQITKAQKRFSTFFQEYTILDQSDKIWWRTVRHQYRDTFEAALLKKFYATYKKSETPDVLDLQDQIQKLTAECESLKAAVHELKLENYKLKSGIKV